MTNEQAWNVLKELRERPLPRSEHEAAIRSIEEVVIEDAYEQMLIYPQKDLEEILLEMGIEALCHAHDPAFSKYRVNPFAVIWEFVGSILVQFEHPEE